MALQHSAEIDPASSMQMGMGTLRLEDKALNCVDVNGMELALSDAVVKQIPYLNTLLLGEFSQLPRNKDGAQILPGNIRMSYLRPIISFLEKQDSLYLISQLGKGENLRGLTDLMDFLCVPVPEIVNLEKIEIGLKNDIKDYTERIARKTYEHHSASYGRRNARSYAADFCLGLHLGVFDTSDHKVKLRIYNLCLFIQSHHRTFKERCRFHLSRLMKEKCTWFTSKQWKSIETWVRVDAADETDTSCSDCGFSNECYDSDGPFSD